MAEICLLSRGVGNCSLRGKSYKIPSSGSSYQIHENNAFLFFGTLLAQCYYFMKRGAHYYLPLRFRSYVGELSCLLSNYLLRGTTAALYGSIKGYFIVTLFTNPTSRSRFPASVPPEPAPVTLDEPPAHQSVLSQSESRPRHLSS